MLSMENPSLDIGVRGLSYIQVEVTGANRDLHSGTYGGAVCQSYHHTGKDDCQLHDENNHITIPGFYDDVVVPQKKKERLLNKAPYQ